jgi:hypothetical protein
MARYKGRLSPTVIQRDFPHVVEIAVPLGGLRSSVDVMYAFHVQRGIQSRHGGWRRDGQKERVRWCFANADTAAAFASMFDGVVCKPA